MSAHPDSIYSHYCRSCKQQYNVSCCGFDYKTEKLLLFLTIFVKHFGGDAGKIFS